MDAQSGALYGLVGVCFYADRADVSQRDLIGLPEEKSTLWRALTTRRLIRLLYTPTQGQCACRVCSSPAHILDARLPKKKVYRPVGTFLTSIHTSLPPEQPLQTAIKPSTQVQDAQLLTRIQTRMARRLPITVVASMSLRWRRLGSTSGSGM